MIVRGKPPLWWILTYLRIWSDHQDVSIGSEAFDVGRKLGVSDFDAVERGCNLAAADLELFDDVADLLETMDVGMVLPLAVANDLWKHEFFDFQ